MNWIFLILGILAGLLFFIIGELLAKKVEVKTGNEIKIALAYIVPFAIFCLLVIIADIIL